MNTVVFDIRGTIAHYRRPDTLGTHATYPFPPRTALRGLVASVLGLSPREDGDALPVEGRCGLRLLKSVQTVTQQLSFHGKKWIGSGPNDSFHRPTTIELVVNPHYRVYYAGPQSEELASRLEAKRSEYHTYLGSAYCLTFPEWVGFKPAEALAENNELVECVTVVPSASVGRLQQGQDQAYARVGGILREHIGGRRFRGSVSVIYEVNANPVVFERSPSATDTFWQFVHIPGEGTICLW